MLSFWKLREKLSNISSYCSNLQLVLKCQRSQAKEQTRRGTQKCWQMSWHTASDVSKVRELHAPSICFYSHLIFCLIIGETF